MKEPGLQPGLDGLHQLGNFRSTSMKTVERRAVHGNEVPATGRCILDIEMSLRAKGLTVSYPKIVAMIAAVLACAFAAIRFHLRQ
jgi:hypothetical protein